MQLLVFILVSLFCPMADAISETRHATDYDAIVAPFYAKGSAGELSGVDGIKLNYRKFEIKHEKGAIIIVSGRGDSHIKYAELLYDLHALGFSVYILDHRGQGFSGRLTLNAYLGHVEHFEDYVTDLKSFYDTVVNSRAHAHHYLIAHSMGGAIAALYAAKHPKDFDAMALSAPMLQINTGKYPEWLARWLADWNCSIGNAQSYAPGQTDPHFGPGNFERNQSTTSAPRYWRLKEIEREAPSSVLGGASNRWVQQGLRATTLALKAAPGLKLPIMMFQAGHESLVRNDGQDKFCEQALNCTKIIYGESKHGVLFEKDAIRSDALKRIAALFSR